MRQTLLLIAVLLLGCQKKLDDRLDMTRFVLIYPGAPVIEVPGDTGKMSVKVRNVSAIALTELRLAVKTSACAATITPTTIDRIVPGDRVTFEVVLTRNKDLPRQRYPLALTLTGKGLPAPAGLDLQLDTSPPVEKGWVNVGQVTLVQSEKGRSYLYLLAGAPLLFLLGWMLWWLGRRRATRKSSQGSPPEDR